MSETRLIRGDALAVLGTMGSGSVGHVVTDPPYGQTNESYDGPVAFNPDLWRECYRVTGPNAALVSFAGSPTYHKIASAIEAGGWKVRQMWGWVYRDGMITSAWPKEGFDRLAPAMDPIVFATKGKVLLRLERDQGENWSRPAWTPGSYSERSSGGPAKARNGHWPRTIAADDNLSDFAYFALSRSGIKADRTGHPNQKPLALMRWLVSKLPHPGPILDPFAGSGTTLEAARLEGFGATGVEQSPDYLAIATRRVAAANEATENRPPPGPPTAAPRARSVAAGARKVSGAPA